MTFNETCIAIESNVNSVLEEANDTLSELYVIESSFNFGVFESSGGKWDKFKEAFKRKLKWLGEKISKIFKAIGDFLMKIFNKVSGRNKLAYNKNAIHNQAEFIKTAITNIENMNTIVPKGKPTKESLFYAFEAKYKDESKMDDSDRSLLSDMTKAKDEYYGKKADNFHNAEKAESYKILKKKVEEIAEKADMSNFNVNSLIPNQNAKADMSIADASATLNKAFSGVKKAVLARYNSLKSEANSNSEDSIDKCKTEFKNCLSSLNIASLIPMFLRTTKIA